MKCPCCSQPLRSSGAVYFPELQVVVSPQGTARLGHVQNAIMLELAQAAPNIVTRERIMCRVYGDRLEPPSDYVITTHLRRLRPKLAALGVEIETIYGGKLRIREALPTMRGAAE